jgi:hypothetical protein
MCSDAPDPDPMIGQAAMANADIAKQALAYYQAKDAAQAPRQAQMDDLTTKLANQQLSTSSFNDQMARDQWARYQSQGIPAEDAMYADAANYDSQAARDKAAGQAATDVRMSVDQANDARRRSLARSGVNPADGRSLASEQDAATQAGLATAGAMNQARNNRETQGIMLRKDAASFGRGATGTAAQTFGVASAAGGQASGAVGSAIGAANQTAQTMGAGFNTAISGNNSAGSLMNTQYSTGVQSAGQGGMGGALGGLGALGQGLGSMGVMFSDENMKEDRQPVDGRAALKGIKATDVEQWKYKPDSPAADGGQPHIGAMAQDLQHNLGDTVSNGKTVDMISAIGANMAATKELAKKVDRLASKGIKR